MKEMETEAELEEAVADQRRRCPPLLAARREGLLRARFAEAKAEREKKTKPEGR